MSYDPNAPILYDGVWRPEPTLGNSDRPPSGWIIRRYTTSDRYTHMAGRSRARRAAVFTTEAKAQKAADRLNRNMKP